MAARASSTLGVALSDLVLAMGVAMLVCSLGVPAITGVVEAARARQSAAFVAGRFRLARAQAAAATTAIGIVFDRGSAGWTFRICRDGNGNGLRRSEIDTGADTCPEGPHDIAALFPGVQIDADAAVRGPEGEPGSDDAVRFGPSDVASFSASGTCTAGSLWLLGRNRDQYVVRVAGVTGRVRVLQYDRTAATWRER